MMQHVAIDVGHLIGEASTPNEALEVCKSQGFTPAGSVDFLAADLAPEVLRYDPDGRGAFIVTCDH